MTLPSRTKIWLVPALILAVTLACAMPGAVEPPLQLPQATSEGETPQLPPPTQPSLPTPTPPTLPPTLVEVDPPPGIDFPLQGSLTLYFNQPMDRPSVEIAFSGEPVLSGRFEWLDDATVTFLPDAPYLPDSDLKIHINTSALALNGQFLQKPLQLNYHTVAPLKAVEVLPEPGSEDVQPTSAIMVSFNNPVVAIGADPTSLPQAFSMTPSVAGQGEWVNTSTYVFYPDPALAGGVDYSIQLSQDLKSITGGPFVGRDIYENTPYEWAFRTDSPRLISSEPGDDASAVGLDAVFHLVFNQPMNITSVEENFNIYGPNQRSIAGESNWSDDLTTLTFTPTQLLDRSTSYRVVLLGEAQGLGGTPLGVDYIARLTTVPTLRIMSTEPVIGGRLRPKSNIVLHFNGPAETDSPLDHVSFDPEVPNLSYWWDEIGSSLYLKGDFEPLAAYTTTVAADFLDPWGAILGRGFTFTFSTTSLEPNWFVYSGATALMVTPADTTFKVQATNIDKVSMRVGTVPFEELVGFLSLDSYESLKNFRPDDQISWTHDTNLPGDESYTIQVPFTRGGDGLKPGIYHLGFFIPELTLQPPPSLIISSNVHLSFKMSATSVFVWAVDLRSRQPLAGASVRVYDGEGNQIVRGVTDAQGVFQSPIPTQPDLNGTYYAVAGEPGDDDFALSLSNWSQGVDGRDFGITTDLTTPETTAYIYTDRPIYHPGQTVYFRAIVRQEYNGRYRLPEIDLLPFTVHDESDSPIEIFELPLSEFGTANSKYTIPEEAQPGLYQIRTDYGSVTFRVAEYRLPEINLQIESPEEGTAGESIATQVEARYFFEVPAGDIPITWNLYRAPTNFVLPGYRIGPDDFSWTIPPWGSGTPTLDELVSSGTGSTSPEGSLPIEYPTDPQEDTPQVYTLEVSATDESGFPTRARSEVILHPADFYIGVRPDAWVGKVGEEIGFEIITVDWEKQPAGDQTLSAQFRKVSWVREDTPDSFIYPTFTPQYTAISSADFRTAEENGIARLAFTPPDAGTYQLDIQGEGARSQVLVWVGGAGQVIWPDLPNNRLQLTADQDQYTPGDTAEIFIPNPFGNGTQVLVTVERDEILRHEVMALDSSGMNYAITLTDQDAPNVYVSVTLIGLDANQVPDFRQGYVNLKVTPVEQTLNVDLLAVSAGGEKDFTPRGEVIFKVRVTDSVGEPVQGELSFAVVDQAVLALAESNTPDILTAFYGEQPLGVRTGMSLVVHARRQTHIPGGTGGEGAEDHGLIIRQDFPETAYWNAEVVTDANGEAELTIELPGNLTTWEIEVRGLTQDTRVGQTASTIIATKDLFVRPVTPRFLVAGDHAELAAVVHNNSANDIQADVSLQGTGFRLDDPSTSNQAISIPAGGRVRAAWVGSVDEVSILDLVFSATGGGYQDAARPPGGSIPVLRFMAPQSFGAAGILDLEGERLEVISLPRTFDLTGGTLQIEMAPSLAAAMTTALDMLEHYPYQCTEQTLSRFLPNLMIYRAIQSIGIDSPDLLARLERTLDEGMQELAMRQNRDGGWSWWSGVSAIFSSESTMEPSSDATISAYVVFGLSAAKEAGVFVSEDVLQEGTNYLLAGLPDLEVLSSTWQLDRLAFQYFVLAKSGAGSAASAQNLFEVREQLSPYARAFLALTLAAYDPGDKRINTLIADLDSLAIRTESGIHWEGKGVKANLDTPMLNTALVVYALAQQEPASFFIPEAVRYLISHHKADGSWGSTYETAWTILALTEVMRGTGELAGDYSYAAWLNGVQLLEGQMSGDARLTPVETTLDISDLYPTEPNGLSLQRTGGPGRLYYNVHLNVLRPAADAPPLNKGIAVSRVYQPQAVRLGLGDRVTVKVTLTLKNDAYYLLVEDRIPAGAEILDTSLKTSRAGTAPVDVQRPYDDGWGWWYFNQPLIFDDRIAWAADYLPAGTYELTYTLVLIHPGEYQVLPARAWEFYFPEVQGNSAGDWFVIEE